MKNKEIGYLEINLTKDVKDFYSKKNGALMKEIKEETNIKYKIWDTMIIIGRLSTAAMFMLIQQFLM
jgi:hypothetical protein